MDIIYWLKEIALTVLIEWIQKQIATFNQTQWTMLICGLIVLVLSIYAAWRSDRIAKYKLSILTAKFGFTLVVLAFFWNDVRWIYEKCVKFTGNQFLAFAMLLAGSYFGFHFISLIKRRK